MLSSVALGTVTLALEILARVLLLSICMQICRTCMSNPFETKRKHVTRVSRHTPFGAPLMHSVGVRTASADWVSQVRHPISCLKQGCGCIGLPAAVLADVVLASMANLPRREDVMGDQPKDPRGGNALLAGFIQVCCSSLKTCPTS